MYEVGSYWMQGVSYQSHAGINHYKAVTLQVHIR